MEKKQWPKPFYDHPDKRVEIEQVALRAWQTITVYMQVNGPDEDYYAVQVELRVRGDGTPEIFCDDVVPQLFKNWKPLK